MNAATPTASVDGTSGESTTRQPYTPPRVTKKRTVARATLFSGGGTSLVGAPVP
ncbi:MAG: hypothetical protein H6700_12705 [Myxococcales bacterium]|nr:hypothetical protein [Myxococcales bacterium]MCB9520967.1 hypothetical protein [Myxococcales bacterium]MCB9532620.1 hypothetical protein [Myxococcales bacterium]